jgi:hypothetical protein
MTETPLPMFERAGSVEEGNMDFGKPNEGIQLYAQLVSIGNRLNIVPDLTPLRRLDLHFSSMNLMPLLPEFMESGTLFGVPMTPYHSEYNEAQAKKAQREFGDAMDKHRAKVIADHTWETFEEPFRWDLETLVGDGGIIECAFDSSMKKKCQEAGSHISVSPVPDNAERFCLHLVQDIERIYNKYIAGVIWNRKPPAKARTYGRATVIRARRLTGVLISLPLVAPILALALIRSTNWRIGISIAASFLNYQFYFLVLRPSVHFLTVLGASLAALYVVFISNNQIILPVKVST